MFLATDRAGFAPRLERQFHRLPSVASLCDVMEMDMKKTNRAGIHQARVYLAQARVRRHQHAFHATLLRWAAAARLSAMPVQRELF